MSIARAIRLLLVLVSCLIVIWSFVDVGRRIVLQRQAERERPITLTILHWGDPAENAIVQTLVERYMADNPHVRIQRIHASEMRSKLKTMLAAGTPPDLFYLPPDLLPEMASLKLIRPIDDFIEQERAAGTAGFFDDYFPVLLDAYRYDVETGVTGKGSLYGLPKDFTTAVFYVNLDLFEAAGVPVPYDGWTWDEFEDVMRRITALNGKPGFERRRIYGGVLQIWPDTLRNILWTYGGEFFGDSFHDVVLDEPAAQEALQMIRRVRIEEQTVFNNTGIGKDGGQEFFNGNIGVAGPVGRWMVPRYTSITRFRWDVVPVPHKAGHPPASQLFMTAWGMTAGTKHPEEAYKLMKFLCGPDGAAMQSRLGLAIPPLRSIAESDDFLAPPGIPPHRADLFLKALEHARVQQLPREAEWGRIVGDRITESIQSSQKTTMQSAKEIEAAWLAELDSPLRRRQWSPMRWDIVMTVVAGAVVTVIAALWWRARQQKLGPLDRTTERAGWLFIMPWFAGFIALTAGPMIASFLLSFTRWSAMMPISQAESVGLANFHQLFAADPTFYKSLQVTGYYVILAVPVGQVAALAVALLMNLKVRGIALFRTIYFVPSVVSGVALAVLWLQIFNKDYGLLNAILRPITGLFGGQPPDWFGDDAQVWAIPAFVIMGLWGVGGGMIIYLAGLKGIPASLYEAARIDGAGPVRQFWNVTLPMLSPLIFFNLVMGIIGSFQVFTQAYVMTGAGPGNATLFYVLNLYRQAFEFHNMGYASAMAWVLFVIVLVLTIAVFRGSRNVVYYEGLRT